MEPVIIQAHDPGCKHAREASGGHSDAARRLADRYNLHKSCGIRRGWIQAKFADGKGWDEAVFPSRAEAVAYSHHGERDTAYVELLAPSMTVCEAASVLRWEAHARALAPADRDQPGGGLVVIPRIGIEELERQFDAMTGHAALPLALGKRE